MIGRRIKPDGLPFRLYERRGKFKVSFGYKLPSGAWEFRLTAAVNNPDAVATVRKQAIERAEVLNGNAPLAGTTAKLIERYFQWQRSLPADSEDRKAAVTLKENEVEQRQLLMSFGRTDPARIKPVHIYAHLAGRAKGGAPAKANKEIALLSAVLEYGRRQGDLETNPCAGIKYNKTRPKQKYVEGADLAYAVAEARARGGSYLILALCAMAAYLTVSRPTEMRELARQSITEGGIRVEVGKRKRGQAAKYKLIEWSLDLKAVIDEALSLQRTTSIYIFGNTSGQVYARSGWNTIWTRLMKYCEAKAKNEGMAFTRFALSDMRPAAVTDRMEDGDSAITDATGHSDGRMVQKVYDRRRVKSAKATQIR